MTHNPAKSKSATISIRVSQGEYDYINQLAQENNQTISRYIRGQALQDASAAKRAVARKIFAPLSQMAEIIQHIQDPVIRHGLVKKEEEIWKIIKSSTTQNIIVHQKM
ncbi:hypothetical protein RFF05_11280 [Bengtsoniella intestinalis]|uniref:plasmid mobilization protein n=1 Tax=Bengtsoniella intestinalis TaxID=3073143 RepID=UPI00391F5416